MSGKVQSHLLLFRGPAPRVAGKTILLRVCLNLKTAVERPFVALLLCFVLGTTGNASAQVQNNRLSANAQIFLATIGPGALVWERFGHNGLWIHDPESGVDRVYHWGLFDFNSENFWPKFLQGYMEYSIGSVDSQAFFQSNMQSDRDIWLQEINFNSDQKNALFAFLKENDSDGNRIYRYDYYLDNCSTRARDALDRVMGGIIKKASVDKGSGKTFRANTRRLLQKIPMAYLGIQLGLGHPADDEISVWKDMFTPMALRRYLNEIQLPDGTPLVLSDKFIFNSSRIKEPEHLSSYLSFYLCISASLGVFFALLGYLCVLRRKTARLLLALLGGLWCLLSALIGTTLFIIWFFTEHRFGHLNENLLQFNPLSLLLAGCFFTLLMCGRLPKVSVKILYAVTGLSLLGLVIQIIPIFHQVNAEIIALALPTHLGLFWAVRTAGYRLFEEKQIKPGERKA